MPDKKYLIDFPDAPDGSAAWEADKWERNKDAFMSEYKDSDVNVFELEDYNPEDVKEHDQIMISFDDNPEGSAVWDSAKWERNKDAFMAENPTAKIQRVRYKDYWGERATANREQRALLAQPDEERNARLADLGYYDDLTGEAFDYTQSEEGIPQWGPSLGLQPLSSIVGENEDGTTSYADPKVAEFFAKDTSYTDRMAEIARLDAEYESNPAVIAQREWEAEWRAKQARYIDEQLAGIRDAVAAEVDTIEAGKGAFYQTASTQGMGDAAIIQQAMDFMKGKDAGKALVENEKMETYDTAAKLFAKAKQANEIAGKGFWAATGDVAKDKLRDLATQSDIEAYNQIGEILSRLEAKIGTLDEKELTDEVIESNLSKEEQALIKGFFAYNEAMANAGHNMSKAYKGGKIFGESISFMLEFLATGGLAGGTGKAAGNLVGKGLVRWASKAAKGTVKRAFRTGVTKTAMGLTSALVGTAARTFASPGTYNRAAEESVKIEGGHLHRGKNVFKSFVDSYIENLSEVSGGLIGKTLGKFGLAPSQWIGNVSFGKIGKMLADNRLAQGIAKGIKGVFGEKGVLKKFGFNGIFEEVEEEYIGNLIREFTIQDGALAEMHKDDNFGAMLIGFAPMTLFGAGISAVQMGAVNIEAANLGKKLRETLGYHYKPEQIDHMMNLVQNAENAKEVLEAIKPLGAGLNAKEFQQLYQYGAFMAQNKAMIFARKAQEDNLAQAKRAEFQQQYGNFWQTSEEGAESVQIAELRDGRTVFVTSAPNESGMVTIIDAETGKQGFTNVSEYAEQTDKEGNTTPATRSWSMDAFLESRIAAERLTAQEARMTREYNEQVQNLQSQITRGTKINLGTTGNPIWMVATGQTSKDGVFAIDSTGATHTIGWNQVADAMNQPIRVKTDQEIIDEEVAAVVARNAERRKKMSNATPAMTEAVDESAMQSAEVVAQENKHIPMNEDGTVNEVAFWEQDPEGYAAWNDEQNQDGGADTRQQIANSKAILAQMLTEAIAQQQTSNPVVRKQAKKNAEDIQAQIDKLTALEAKYEEQRIAPFRERAMKWIGLTNAPVHIIETEEELAKISSDAANASGRGARVRGMAKDGKAYIYLPGIVEASEIDAVFMHEAVAHTGLKGMLGQQAFDELCDQVWEMMSPEARQVFIGYPGVNGNKRAAADEYIAHIAERMGAGVATAEEKTIWQKIVDFVRNVLRAMGVDINLSESELADLLQMAYADLAKNMAEAEKIAAQNEAAAKARKNAPTAARQKYDEWAKTASHEEIKAGAQNEFNKALKEYNDLQAQAPKVEMGESVEDFIARKKAHNEDVAKAKALVDEKQTMMDEIARREKPAEEAPTPVVEEAPSAAEPFMEMANSDTHLSIRTEDGLQANLREFMQTKEGQETGWTEQDLENIIAETSALIDAIHKSSTGNEFYDAFAQKDPTIRVDWRDGVAKPTVTWTRANIDYKYDMSADLLCINNEGLEAVLSSDKMVALMELFNPTKAGTEKVIDENGKVVEKKVEVTFGSADYLELYNTLKDLGFVVPCKGCFDAAGRFKMLPSVATKFAQVVNSVIDERNRDPEAFDAMVKATAGEEKTVEGLPTTAENKLAAIRVGVAGDKLTEHVKWTQLMSADGQTKMLSDWGGIFRAWQRTGAGRPKDKLLPEPYYGDIVSSHSTIIGAYGDKTPSFRDTLVNAGTGLRRNSHSEFRPVLAIDEIQFMRDAFIKNLTVFKYMKELDDVRLFGKIGVKFNMSFFPEFVPGTKAAGLDANGDYIASEESVGSREFPYIGADGKRHYDGMKGWAEAQKYINKDVSLSSVIFSIPHLIKALTDVPTRSDKSGLWGSVIPYHASGATASQIKAQGLGSVRAIKSGTFMQEAFTDYDKGVTNFEDVQNDRFGEGWVILEGKKKGQAVTPGHKMEFANGTHYYNADRGVHIFSSGYILDAELPEGALLPNGMLNLTKEQREKVFHKFEVSYNDKVRELKTAYAYQDAADYYLEILPQLGIVPRFDFAVPENIFLEMCEAANVDPRHPKLGWKGEGHSWSPIDSEAYYALFCDYGMTDPATGKYSPHKPVGYVNEEGQREFRLPENTVEIVREGLQRFTDIRRSENARIDEAIEAFAARSVAKGRISQESVDKVLSSDDTRLSVITPQMDADYLAAVEAGDMETAQRMVLEAARLAMPNTKVVDENGNPLVVWRASRYGKTTDYTVFEKDKTGGRGFFFTNKQSAIERYGGENLRAFFLNITNPDVSNDFNVLQAEEKYTPDNDGVIFAPDGIEGINYEVKAFESSQIKSAEPVTYDDNGNVIPLSERFNPENEDVRFSARTDEQREALFDKAKAQFGLTNNFKVAGYMLPDGSLLDFSEANDGGDPNQRTLDHREIEGIIMDEGKEYDSRWMYLADFMNEGAIRLLPEYAGINLMKAPTKEQRSRLFDFIYKYDGEVILEIADERLNNVAYVEYDRRTSPSRIFRDIDGYFNEGIVPEQDIRFSVIGEVGALRDKTPEGIARLENLDVARQMESQLNPDWSAKEDEVALKIKVATGWERGADGLWRYETEDIKMKPILDWLLSKKKLKLGDIVEDGELLRLYPDLANITIVKMRGKYDLGAAYIHSKNQIELPFGALKDDYDDGYYWGGFGKASFKKHANMMYEDLIHEVQHAIQRREGFARGGSESTMNPKFRQQYNDLTKRMITIADEYNAMSRKEQDEPRGVNLYNTYNSLMRSRRQYLLGKSGYKRLAGENEANNVEKRKDYTPEQRRNTLLASTEDVAREDMIFIMNSIEEAENSLRFSVFEPHNATIDEIDGLFRDYNMDESLTPLYDKVSALAHTMDLKIRFDYPWSAAAGSTFGDKVKFNTEFFNSLAYKSQDKAHALLHEMIHATTNYAIAARNTGALTEGMKEAVSQLEGIYGEIANDSAFDGTYGARSIYEMVAELSNPEFRSLLKEKNLFQRIVDAIKRLLGIEVGENALDNLSATLDYMLDNYDGRVFGAVVNQYQKHQEYTRFSVVNENQAIFVSNAARAVEGIKMEKATPAQWLAMIEKSGGLKAGEDKWMGLSDWLKASDRKTLTKAEVLEFIGEHMIRIEEERYDLYAEEKAADVYDEIQRTLQSKFDAYKSEHYAEYDDYESDDALEYAMDKLHEEMEDSFPYTIEREYGSIYLTFPYEEVDDLKEWADKLGIEFDPELKPVNETRAAYTTDGLTNKKEIALVVPTIKPWNEYDDIHFGDAGNGRAVAWIRFGETTDEAGNNILVIDEIQSKRHQEGREQGYDNGSWDAAVNEVAAATSLEKKYIRENPSEVASYILLTIKTEEGKALAQKLLDANQSRTHLIPDAPFEKNWHELAMKRMLRYAAEEGYDFIAWTKGDQQAERYNIGKVISGIHKDQPTEKGYQRFEINSYTPSAPRFIFTDNEGKIVDAVDNDGEEIQDYVGKNLSEVFGKDLAIKMLGAEENTRISHDEMRVGGEGMKGFYDKMLPAFMNKYGKKWGIKVEDITLPDVEEAGRVMHSVPVTEEMKASVMEGQVMFSAVQIDPVVRQEMDTIKAKAMWDGSFMKAPNGADTKLTEDQWLMVRTKNFKNWFGDWINDPENASKVIDENGEPKVVYHGTSWNPLEEPSGGAVFKSGWYAGIKSRAEGFGEPVAVFLNIKNPAYSYVKNKENDSILPDDFDLNHTSTFGQYDGYISYIDYPEVPRISEIAKRRIMIMNPENYEEVINQTLAEMPRGRQIFSAIPKGPSQVKSATETTGLFSESGDIRFSAVTEAEEVEPRFSVVTDPALLDQLNNEEYITLYRAMQVVDGKLYPPMAGKVAFKEGEEASWGEPTPEQTWLQSYETPWNAVHARYDEDSKDGKHKKGDLKYNKNGDPVWVFKLDKGNGKTLYAAYNPYIHTSASPLNDQFSEAQSRDNLVVVRVFVPKSELTSGYKAEKAKDSVGMKPWHKGPISGVLAQYEGKGREVMLTRYAKIDGIVDFSKVADETIRLFEGTGLLEHPLPTNVFMPGLRKELEKRGVQFVETTNKGEIKEGADKGKTWASIYGKDGLGKKPKTPRKAKKAKEDNTRFSAISTTTDNVVAEGMKFSIQDFARLAGNIFQDMPESFRKEAIEETFKRGWDMQSAIFQIPARLAEKENWDEADKDLAKVIREKVQDAMDESGVVMSRPLTTKEALWMLYRSTEANGDSMLDAAKRAMVAHNLGFDSRSMALKEKADDYIRYSVVRNGQIDAATDMYNYEANLWTNRLKESWLDMNQSVIALQDALEKASGKPIASWENVVLALNQLSSKSYAEKKKYLRDFLMPLWDQIIEMTKVSGLSIEQIERYMMLKHGLERNKKFAMRDAKQFYREMYDKVADRMKNTSHAEQAVALSEANKRIADIDAQIATASGKKLKDLQEARERAVVEKEIAELVLRNDEQQNEADLQMYFNAIEAENNPKYAEFREKDYGGLTSMFMDQIADVKRSDYKTDEAYQAALLASVKPRFDKVADMEAEAQKEVDDYENKAHMPALWKLVNAATKETLRHQHAAGMITTEQYDAVRNMFDYYVPLRGFADNTAEDMYSYYMNNSAGGFAKPIIAAKGRKTRAESPLGWIGTMAESAIQQDNKNEVKMKLYYALMNRPDTGVLSLSEMWYEYDHTDPSTGRKVFVPAYPPATGGVLTADQMRQHMDAWEQSMKAKQAIGEAYKKEQGVNLGGSVIFQDKAQDAEHIIRVKVAGKDYAILVNGNPRAAQAINGLLNPDANVGPVRQWYGALRRGLSALMTSFSPLFWVANYQRDLLSSFMRTSLNEGWGQAFKYLGNRFHGWKAAKYIYKYDNGTMGDSYYENLYKEFAENGGITGYTSLTTNKEYEKLLADYAENVDKEMLNWIKGVWDKFMGFGEAIEQVSRFAAYITARESGKSIEEAVAAAKEVSVNFNRKGSTSPISLDELEKLRDKNGKPLSMPKKAMAIAFSAMPSALKELYFFFNASIQALSSSAKLARKSPGKAMAWAGMYMGLSVGLAFLNYLLAGDDDDNDYLDLPDYLRHSTALFKMGDNYYFKWSLPQEMRPFYATADILVSKIMGKTPHKTAWDTVGDIALAAAEWLPVNPFGTEDPILALVPDVAAPLAEIKANQNSFGGRIYNDMSFKSEDVAKQIPAYRKGTSKTGEIYVDMAEFLNDITGGDEVQKGVINLNPAMVEHLVEGYGGGIYDFGKMVIGIPGLIYDAVWGEGVEVRDIPFVNKVLLSTDETNMNSHVNEAFYYYQGIADNAKRVENEYRKSDDPSRADDYMAEDDWRIYMLFRQYEEDLKMADEKVLDAVDDTEKELAFQEQNVIREMLLNDIARGVRPSTETIIKVAVESIRKESNDLLKPSREAERKLSEAKRRRNQQAADAAKREFDSLRDLPEYKRGMSLKKDLDKIKRNLDKLQYMSPGTQRDSVLDKVQRDYDALLKKARVE